MYKKIMALLLLTAGVMFAGEWRIAMPVNKQTGKSDLIPAKIYRQKIQKTYGNPMFTNLLRWGNGQGAAAVLGPYDSLSSAQFNDWEGTYGKPVTYGLWPTYDQAAGWYYWGAIQVGDTFASWFKAPARCTVVAFSYFLYNPSSEGVPSATFSYGASYGRADVNFAKWTYGRGFYPDTEASGFGAYVDYYYLDPADRPNYYGPIPYDLSNTIVAPAQSAVGQGAYNFTFYPDAGVVDITDTSQTFFLWFSPQSQGSSLGMPHVLGSIWTSRDQGWHSWIFAPNRIGATGWFNFPHGWAMDAYVWIYEDIAPTASSEQLPWTFSTGPFTIRATAQDPLGIPSQNQGVKACTLAYVVNTVDTFYVSGTLVSGDSVKGVWEFNIGPFNVYDTITYWVSKVVDYSNLASSEAARHTFVIIQPAASDSVLFVDEDQDAWAGYAYDILNYLLDFTDGVPGNNNPTAFYWDASTMGYPDASVLDASRFKVIFWTAWGPTIFASDTVNIKNYLDAGGNLFISSQDLVTGGFDLGDWTTEVNFPVDYPNHFCRTYLKIGRSFDDVVGGVIPNADTVVPFYGFATDPISDPAPTYWAPMDSILYYGFEGYNYAGYVFPDDENNSVFDTLFPCWFYEKNVPDRQSGTPTGYWYDGPTYGDPYKLVLFYWNYQYLVDSVAYDTAGNVSDYVFDKWRENELTKRILDFFGFTVDVKELPKVRPSDLRLSLRAPSITGLGKVTVLYTLPSSGDVKVGLYDASGRLIRNIFQGRKKAGAYAVTFSTTDLKAGTYFVRLEFGKKSRTQKLVFVK